VRGSQSWEIAAGGLSSRLTSAWWAQPRAPALSSTWSHAPEVSRTGTTSPSRSVPMGLAEGEAASRSGAPRRTTAAGGPLLASLARPTAAVVRRGAPLLDAASPSANPTGTLREGEVVPVLDVSGDWLQVEDNAGARGWAHQADVRRLDRPPATASQD